MIKVDENGELVEKMAVMEGLQGEISLLLYKMYRHILDDVKASEFPEGEEMDHICGALAEVKESTPWLQQNIGKQGFILLTSEHYSLIGFPHDGNVKNPVLNIAKMGYGVWRNEDLQIIEDGFSNEAEQST
jgi:hypothetical protein